MGGSVKEEIQGGWGSRVGDGPRRSLLEPLRLLAHFLPKSADSRVSLNIIHIPECIGVEGVGQSKGGENLVEVRAFVVKRSFPKTATLFGESRSLLAFFPEKCYTLS